MAIVQFIINQTPQERLGVSILCFGLALVCLSVIMAIRAIDDL
jgi:hypothetical protein